MRLAYDDEPKSADCPMSETSVSPRKAVRTFRLEANAETPSGHWPATIEISFGVLREDVMARIITGVFENRRSAEDAVQRLLDAAFSQRDISVLMSDSTQGREFGVQDSSKAPEGAVAGATAGGILGALAAGLVAVGVLAVPGLGLVAAGPILAALAGAGAGGAAGGLIGGLVGAGIPEHEAKMYSEELANGGILVGIYVHDDTAKIAESILETSGAKSVANR